MNSIVQKPHPPTLKYQKSLKSQMKSWPPPTLFPGVNARAAYLICPKSPPPSDWNLKFGSYMDLGSWILDLHSIPGLRRILVLLLSLLLASWTFPASAILPAPDNYLYGLITVNGHILSTTDTNFVVEAGRIAGGTPVVAYRLGTDSSFGSNYVLRIPMEELPTIQNTNASLVGDTLFLTIRSNNAVVALGQVPSHVLPERGFIRKLDITIGTASSDSDNDGLPDIWELTYFGSLTNNATSDPFNKGVKLLTDYIAGTNPTDTNDVFKLFITQIAPDKFVSFYGRRAEGPGYESRSRHYALEYSTNVVDGPWTAVPGYTNMLGNNANIIYPSADFGDSAFFRGRVWLEQP
jgi:hypothetical protein